MSEEILELSAQEKVKVRAIREDDSIILTSIPRSTSKNDRKENLKKHSFVLHMFDGDKIDEMVAHNPIYDEPDEDSFIFILLLKIRKALLT